MQLTEIVLHSTSIIVVVIAAILALQLIRLSGKTNTWIYLSVGILLLAIASFEQYLEHTGISAGLFTNHVFIDALRLGTSKRGFRGHCIAVSAGRGTTDHPDAERLAGDL